jgi:hypothetical protein
MGAQGEEAELAVGLTAEKGLLEGGVLADIDGEDGRRRGSRGVLFRQNTARGVVRLDAEEDDEGLLVDLIDGSGTGFAVLGFESVGREMGGEFGAGELDDGRGPAIGGLLGEGVQAGEDDELGVIARVGGAQIAAVLSQPRDPIEGIVCVCKGQ